MSGWVKEWMDELVTLGESIEDWMDTSISGCKIDINRQYHNANLNRCNGNRLVDDLANNSINGLHTKTLFTQTKHHDDLL